MAVVYSNPLHRRPNFDHPPELTHVDLARPAESESQDFEATVTDKSMLEMETVSDASSSDRVNVFIVFVFILELLVLVFVCVLEYFLRLTDVFPVRELKFSCQDEDLSYKKAMGEQTFHGFAYNADVSEVVIISLCFCVPPTIILIAEVALWAFSEEDQKMVRALCKQCRLPQVVRRMIRYIGAFLFGLVITMVFTDVTKLMTGRLRPRFLEICKVNFTLCKDDELVDESVCLQDDEDDLRDARLSFPSLHCSMTAFAAVYMAIYLHHVIRTPTVKVMRPLLSLAFLMLAVMCGLSRYGLYYSHWTDVAAGFALGLIIAIYLGVFVLNDFRENLSGRKLYSKLTGFLHQQRNLELRDLYKENWDNLERHGYLCPYHPNPLDTYYNSALIIPRPHINTNNPNESNTDVEYIMREHSPSDRALQQRKGAGQVPRGNNHNTFQRDLQRTLDNYRGTDNLAFQHSHM